MKFTIVKISLIEDRFMPKIHKFKLLRIDTPSKNSDFAEISLLDNDYEKLKKYYEAFEQQKEVVIEINI